MQREIKFRVWDPSSKKMFVPDVITGDFGNVYASGRDYENGINCNDCPLMQYTGLKDVKGREIYEGDILVEEIETGKYQPFVVKWHDDYAGFDMSSSPCWTILGNIYENPELLK